MGIGLKMVYVIWNKESWILHNHHQSKILNLTIFFHLPSFCVLALIKILSENNSFDWEMSRDGAACKEMLKFLNGSSPSIVNSSASVRLDLL